jgi:hypothetical protein
MNNIKRLIISSAILWLFILFILVVQASAAMQGQFKDVTAGAGVRYKGETWGASWGDMNGDGWLDLWVGNHGIRGKGPGLYRNNKNGTFTNVVSALAGYRGDTDVHSAAWSDFDNDGDQDLFITTGGLDGRCLEPQCGNQLFVNENGRFHDLAVSMGWTITREESVPPCGLTTTMMADWMFLWEPIPWTGLSPNSSPTRRPASLISMEI